MIKSSLIDSGSGKVFESFKTAFGRLLGVTTPAKVYGRWNSVTWADAVSETALVSPIGNGSIEICDIFVTAEKKSGGTIRVHFDDGTNEKDLFKSEVDDGSINVATNFAGSVKGWQGAALYYTIVGTYSGSLMVTYIKHDKENSETYADMAKESGW